MYVHDTFVQQIYIYCSCYVPILDVMIFVVATTVNRYRPFIHSFIHLFIHSFIHLFIHFFGDATSYR